MSDSINCFFEQESSLQNNCNEMSASSTFQQEPLLTLHSSTNFNQHNANNSTANTTSVTLASIPEPPPYDEFVEYTWAPEFSAIFQSEDFGQPQQLLNPEDEKFIFGDFLGNLQEDPNYIFNPILPKNMPVFPSPILDNGCSSSSSKTVEISNNNNDDDDNDNNNCDKNNNVNFNYYNNYNDQNVLLIGNNHIYSHNNNNSISTLSLIDHESSLQSPKLINNNNNNLYLPSSSNIPAKRKQNNDDDKSRRRSSIPRLTPINTKLSMSQIHSAPISPPMQISNLSINSIDSNTNSSSSSNGDDNNNNYYLDESPISSSNQSPLITNREIIKNDIINRNDDIIKINHNDDNSNGVDSSSNNNNKNNKNHNNNNSNNYRINNDAKNELSSLSLSSSSSSATITTTETKQEIKSATQKSSKKPHKELLTEEEKRANHIASEQKRRNTIRAGFKELTDIIPTLKNVNNSKSTILFKAIGYIKHLERRNRNLKERAGLLEMRFEMEMRQSGKGFHHHNHHGPYSPTMGFGHQKVAPMSLGNNTYGVVQNSLNNSNGMTTITTIPPQPQSSRLSLSMSVSDHHHVTHDFHLHNQSPTSSLQPHVITHHRPSHHPIQNLLFVPNNADILSQQTITTPNNN